MSIKQSHPMAPCTNTSSRDNPSIPPDRASTALATAGPTAPAMGTEAVPFVISILAFNLCLVYLATPRCPYIIGPGYTCLTQTPNPPLITCPTVAQLVHIFDTYILTTSPDPKPMALGLLGHMLRKNPCSDCSCWQWRHLRVVPFLEALP